MRRLMPAATVGIGGCYEFTKDMMRRRFFNNLCHGV